MRFWFQIGDGRKDEAPLAKIQRLITGAMEAIAVLTLSPQNGWETTHMAWPKDPSGEWYQFDGEILIPVNPASGSAILYLRPNGGMARASRGGKGRPRTAADYRHRHQLHAAGLQHDPTPARRHGRSSPRQ